MRYLIVFICTSVTIFSSCESQQQKLQKKIRKNESVLLADSMVTTNEDSLVKILVADYQAYAAQFNTDTLAPEYLFKAADLNKSVRNFKAAIDNWGFIIQKYPQSKQAPFSLFLQAFSYENDLSDTARAKLIYEDFLKKYPTHQLAKSAQSSIDNMGVSLEELVKRFEEQNKKTSVTN
jgi:outer membrane protein assembly factor BamD (BamD/ComL family)